MLGRRFLKCDYCEEYKPREEVKMVEFKDLVAGTWNGEVIKTCEGCRSFMSSKGLGWRYWKKKIKKKRVSKWITAIALL